MAALTIFDFCKQNNTEMLINLVRDGEDINQKNNHGYTPLHIAARYNSADCLIFLINNGADIYKKDCWGGTPLHTAADYGSADCLKILVQKGGIKIVNERDNDGSTALHSGSCRSVQNLKILIDAGADVTAKDNYGRTFLCYFISTKSRKEIEDYIQYISTLDIKEPSC